MSEIEKQLQMRELLDNSPMREKLLELKHWEKTMKVKEKELKSTNNIEVTEAPPVRSKIKQNGTPNATNTNGAPERAVALDVEASANLDKANLEKERGNKLVGVKDYTNAILHYSLAIEYNPKDPAFFMNRALCHLRLEKSQQAIADCDAALVLDKGLSKAYFRRMQSHIQLLDYDAALGDCIQMIKLDPTNPSLRKEFDRIRLLKIDKENGGKKSPSGLTPLKVAAEEPYWEPKPKKLWSKFGPDEEEVKFQDKAPHLRSKKPLKRISIIETFSPPAPCETFPDHIVDKLFNNFTGESTSNAPVASTSRSPTALFSPYTPLYGSFNGASPLITPSSPITSSALNLGTCSPDRSIDDIFGGITAPAQATKGPAEESIQSSNRGPLNFESGDTNPLPTERSSAEDKTDVMKPIVLPSPNQPVQKFNWNGVQFVDAWNGLKEDQRFDFLRRVHSQSKVIGKLGASLDDAMLTELLDCISSYFCPKDLNIGDILTQLSQNSEMGILSMMMGEKDRRTVKDLLSYVKSRQELSAEAYASLERAFSG